MKNFWKQISRINFRKIILSFTVNFWKEMTRLWKRIPNWFKVILSSLISFYIIWNFKWFSSLFIYDSNVEIIKQGGFWTLFTLIVSSPVAFMIWSFRDRNATDQINNSRKDTNLKEYHKIVEWITHKDSSDELKISAIYSLRRFYEDESLGFQQSALHLLLSTWESMQKDELAKLKIVNNLDDARSIINSLRKNGNSPLGVAITQVLLSNNGKYILNYSEVFSSICLAGMNFYLPGLSSDIVNSLFNNKSIKYSGIQLQGCKFKRIDLNDVDFSHSSLLGTSWNFDEFQDESFWNNVNFKECDFRYSDFSKIIFTKCDFSSSNFMNATLAQLDINESTHFWGVNLINSSMISTDLIKKEQFLGSIIFQSDLSNWIYEYHNHYEQKGYTLEEAKELGIFVLFEGQKQYKLCQLTLSGKSILPPNFNYVLENISISDDDTRNANSDWKVEIKDLK
ncbi:pentapeptide repeat-containing protein [Aggregatibacter actinomycetemcomitans]|uniref:pentapeptide repeat-containing protein n=1 Tax=Aggregatibacter actinomycetemcomitans TaxID=714 RepID=UPI00197C6A22|nr:pentapeptide repeat-containing protein [Aggregatibacter actinomycetemcomitans]MBN6067624.1 pentapeptide repeat-containing protein [Aggregatibacter actinomycetemcomitans]MBN6086299.1 pentapeptide repeat-containing protein [Aggregatibacter actinomycetemcomitans]